MQYVLKALAGLCLLLFMILSPHPVGAQWRDTIITRELEEVQVSGSKKRSLVASVSPVQVLSGNALQRLNSFSIADAIRYFSGVQLKDYGGIGGLKTVNVRGMGTQHVGVFYDGMQLGNAQNGIVDLGKFSLDNIEEVSLHNSQNPDIFQSAKSFGAASSIYIKALPPTFKDSQSYQVKAAFKTGSFGLINPSIHWQQKLADNIATTISAELINAHGRYKTRYKKWAYDTTIVRQNAGVASQRVELAVQDINKDSATHWKIQGYFYNSERGLPGAIVAERFYNSQRLWDRNFFTQGSLQHRFSPRYRLLLQFKYANDLTRYLDTTIKKIGGAPLHNTYKQQEYYTSLVNEFELKKWWTFSLAADWTLHQMQSNLDDFAYPTRQTKLVAVATELSWEPVTISGNLLGSFINEKVKQGKAADDKQELTPAINLSWMPWEAIPLNFRSFYKRIFRMPTFNDLYYTIVGSATLKPEYSNQYNIGAQYNKYFSPIKLDFNVQADVYINKVQDKIIAIPANNLFRWSMINLGAVEIKGLDVHASYFLTLKEKIVLNGTLNYSYQEAVNKTTGQRSYGNLIPYAPRHSGSATLQVFYRNWGVNYSFIYTGERYMLPENDPQNYLMPWYTHDLSLTKKLVLGKTALVVAAEVNNLFNQYYDVVINYPMPGRNYLIKLSFNL
ncbi:TonB-dependent receptor [Niabella yanshanensis]|uniref:TonB-dependent receptor n=1 Tax=Niabella yanshanensis TaxID=577386 RepID=A0ABZ0W295_9BACT|nr:TonB-dependent receptor [Niabella yanshanensis]WQD36612.1 TonB-dependent receptor [Niabella yanshanensis]